MRFSRSFVWVLAAISSAVPTSAQAPRLQFLNRIKDDTTLSGAVTVKVSSDPILRPKGIKVGIQVDSEPPQSADALPWSYVWDSTNAPDGRHVIRLVLVNTRTNETGTVDEIHIFTSNRVERAPAAPREESRSARQQEHPRESINRDERAVQHDAPLEAPKDQPKAQAKDLAQVQQQPHADSGQETDAEVVRAANAPEFSASSLQVEAGKLLIGRRDGSLTVYDPVSKDGWSVRPPFAAGDVLAATRSGNLAAWLCGDSASQSSSQASSVARWLFVYREKEKKVRTFNLASATSRVRRVSLWQGKPILTGSQGGFQLDLDTGAFRDLDEVVGSDGSQSLRGAEVAFIAADNSAILIALGRASRTASLRGPAVSPGEMAAWKCDGRSWKQIELPPMSTPGLEGMRQVVATPERLGVLFGTGVAGVSLTDNRGDIQRVDFPSSDLTGRSASQLSLSGTHLWCVRGTSLFHVDLATGKQDAFLPWNISGLVPRVIAAEADTLWVSSNQGIKRLNLSKPDPEIGYAGFVRARLGEDQDRASTESGQRLTQEIEAWQGTPYLWGGESKSGVDCSGFVMRAFQSVGVRLDHGSDYLRTCSLGSRVRDELVYGDVLVFPGHCAIYTGDGSTAETVDKSVGRASIWRRSSVVVRRFLGASAMETRAFASRSTGYHKARGSSTTRKRKSS